MEIIVNYQHNEQQRKQFNQLCQSVWRFDFEYWYQSGYWGNDCIIYSLLDKGEIVSHVTVSVMKFVAEGEEKTFVQLGTVMTKEGYRKQGLNKILMNRVLDDWKDRCDMMFLYANDSVLHYYQQFGLAPAKEHQYTCPINKAAAGAAFRKMDIDQSNDFALLDKLARVAHPQSALAIVDNVGLVMFYCKYMEQFSLKDNLYYSEELDAIAVIEYDSNDLIIYDILAPNAIDATLVANSLAEANTQRAIFRFAPIQSAMYAREEYKDEDVTLFVSKEKVGWFEANKLIFSLLSHT